VADAQVRARIAERQSSDAGVALSAATVLVRELRGLLEGTRAPSPPAPAGTEGRSTVAIEPGGIDAKRKPDRSEPVSRERSSPRARVDALAPK
jgi:hypothetical protein